MRLFLLVRREYNTMSEKVGADVVKSRRHSSTRRVKLKRKESRETARRIKRGNYIVE